MEHSNFPDNCVFPFLLLPLEIWQMDITHIPEFGRNKYLHVTIDTYSGYTIATPLTRESTQFVIDYLFRCFATPGIPQIIKTDNGQA